MTDCKTQLISDVTGALITRLEPEDVEVVSDEMLIALRDYQVTRNVTDLAIYEGYNEKILQKYVACMMIEGKSPKTIAAYERIVKKLFLTLRKDYTDMTVSDLRYFLALEKNRGISNRTLENTRVQISSFFTWMLNEDMISKNPCRPIKPIKYEDKVRLPFSTIEIDAIRSACRNYKERAIVELLLSTGVRVSELCALCISDINFDTMTIKVREGKGSKQRTAYMNDLAKKHLLNYLEHRNCNGGYLFYNKKKQPLNPGGVRHILNTIGDRASVDNVHPHRFRRTFATGMSNRGMEIHEVSKLLGHVNINTTMEYVYTSDERVHISYMKYSV